MKRRDFLRLFCSGISVSMIGYCSEVGKSSELRPNILFIMSDDHAANAIGCYGSRLKPLNPTPNIDKLAQEGVRLTNCFCTNSICTPSRATILTGKYSHRNNVYTLGDTLDPRQNNVAKILQKSGYQTAMIGKWHLKSEPSGFDYWNILPGQGRYVNPILIEMGSGTKEYAGHSTDVITDLSLKWLDSRDRQKPFFLMCHYKATHESWEYAKRFQHLYTEVEIPEPESLWEDKSHRSQGSKEYGFTIETLAKRMSRTDYHSEGPLLTKDLSPSEIRKATYQKFLKIYLRTAAGIDENVGRILDYLDNNDLNENTVVIYTSDQGYFLGEHNYIDKRWMFEESLKMPFILRYPREIKERTTNEDMTLNTDFAALFLDYAGIHIPADMQGKSFRNNVIGKTPPDWRESVYYRYWQHTTRPAHYGIRTKKYKLIFFYGLPLGKNGTDKLATKVGWELYDLEKDPFEVKNVYSDSDYSEIITNLKIELLRLKSELGDTDDQYPEMQELVKKYW